MKKTLIALAVLGAFGAAQAQSNVTIYGQLNPSYDYVKISNGTGAQGDAKYFNMADNSSRVGFKGTEDLGGGLKAIFQLESYFNFVDGDSGADGGFGKSRDAWVGLQGGFGSITFGAHDNALKKMFASYDPFGDTIADYNNIFSNGIDSRNSKSAYYTSPTMSGFSANVSYALENARDSDDDATHNSRYAIGVEYKNGPVQVTAAYNKLESDGGDWKGFRLGAAYTLPTKTTLSVVYDQEKGADADYNDRKAFMLGVQHPINNIDLIATFIMADDLDGVSDSGAKNLNLGARYNFSKRTNLMAMYTYLKNDDNGGYALDTGYGGGDIGTAGDGAKYSAFSVRLQHKF